MMIHFLNGLIEFYQAMTFVKNGLRAVDKTRPTFEQAGTGSPRANIRARTQKALCFECSMSRASGSRMSMLFTGAEYFPIPPISATGSSH
jgi:hypothetical protein